MATVRELLNDLAQKLTLVKKLDAPAMQKMQKAQEAASKVGKEIRDSKG